MLSNETIINSNEYNLFEKILVTIIFICICIVGVIGNLIVLIVGIRKQNYKFVTNCYIINLAITDLLFLLISVPLTTYLGFTNTWMFSGFINCHVQMAIAHVLLQTTCYTLAAMSIDRYLYVINIHPRPKWRTPMNALIICIIIWIVSIIFVFPYKSFLSRSEIEKKLIHECRLSSYHPLFSSCLFPFCAFYILPLIIIALSYTRLCFYMRNVSKSITRYRKSVIDGPRPLSKRRRVTRTLLSLTFAFAICWFPIHLLEYLNCKQMLDNFYDEHSRLLDTIRVTAHALSYFNSCLNPVLYALYNRDFFI